MKKLATVCLVSSLLAACSSRTVIHSKPQGAKVYLNHSYSGVTPYTHRDSKIVGTKTRVKLVLEGYEPFMTSFARDEKVDAGAVVGGVFLLFPFIWTMKYMPERTYELDPLSTPATGELSQP